MTKKLYFLISLVLLLSVASIGYGAPTMIKLDMNNTTDNNEPNTQPGFTRFVDANSGMEDVNGQPGLVVELGGNITSYYRNDPNNKNDPCILCGSFEP